MEVDSDSMFLFEKDGILGFMLMFFGVYPGFFFKFTIWVFPEIVVPLKTSILIGFSMIFTIHFGFFPPIVGNTHIFHHHSHHSLRRHLHVHMNEGHLRTTRPCPWGVLTTLGKSPRRFSKVAYQARSEKFLFWLVSCLRQII